MDDLVLRAIYREALASVHYSSIPQFLEYLEGRTADPRFGTSCGFQALEVGRRLASQGATVRYYMDGRHAAVICDSSAGDPYLLDPYLMHADAINLHECMGPDGALHDAYPCVTVPDGKRHASKLRVRYAPQQRVISLEYMRLNSTTLSCSLNRYFKLRLERPLTGPPSAKEITSMLYHPEQNNLSVRILDCREGSLSDLIYPICYHHGEPAPRAEHLVVRTSRDEAVVPFRERDRFSRAVERMASVVGATSEELIAFVLDGARTYERHAPACIDYVPYTAYKPQAA